ncbi:melanoma cell adhesion molecule b isoform X5 [Myripristis murdjan]|uniref:melanoma cell adhesion molecule b isoform X5 n=1 Tax=Myripristis murdjan TaxID=586833 RepID=UPI0011762DFB|nr:cell surface glycoprotein MUC18-like isoform X5 [Myripristis murdjan]
MAVRDTASLLAGLLVLLHTWGAWATVEVGMEDRVEVFRGDTAQIACMFTSSEGIGALTIEWFYLTPTGQRQKIYKQDSTMKSVERGTQFTGRISVNGTGSTGELVLTITDVLLEDEVEFICQINSLTEGDGEGHTQLRVFETPELPSIERVHTGISVSNDNPSKIGSCEVKNGYPKPNITWYRDNTPLYNVPDEVSVLHLVTMESSGLYSVRSDLNLKVMKSDKDASFYCEVSYFVPGGTRMTETNRINITVHYTSTVVSMWVESPKGEIKEGDMVELQCQGDGNPKPVFTFRHNDIELDPDTTTLVLENVTRSDSGLYECVTMNFDTYEEITGNTSLFVNYLDDAVVIPEGTAVLSEGEEMTATCNALSSLTTQTTWFKVFKPVSQKTTEDGVHSVVSVKVTSDINAFCNASNDYGTDAVAFSIKAITHTTTSTTTTTTTTTSTSTTTTTVKTATAPAIPPKKIKKEGSGVIVAVIIICILLLAILGSVLYFLYKKGKICGRSGKQDLTKEKSNKDNIVVEMKSDNTEEAVLLGVNGDKKPSNDQGDEYLDVQK